MIQFYYKFLLVISLCFVCGCESSSSGNTKSNLSTNEKINIVATVGMVADLVNQVGGKHVQVSQIMGAGVDPHLYKATRDDVRAMMDADMVFYSGLHLEGKMIDTLTKLAAEKPVIAVTSKLDESSILHPSDAEGHPDPHAWMDVAVWSKCLDVIEEQLSTQLPEFKTEFQSNKEIYRAELQKLDEYGKASLQTIPQESRLLITSHDAFNYFGRAYNLEVQGVQGISTESEAGLLHVNQLVNEIVRRKVKSIFIESSVSQKSIEAIMEGVRTKGHQITIGGILFSDAMGEQGTYEGSYLGMLDHNITVVCLGLGGVCPEKGLNGKLSSYLEHH